MLQAALKFRAKSPSLNRIVCEIALVIAPLGLTTEAVHIWSEDNALCDSLSRVEAETSVPVGAATLARSKRSRAEFLFLK